MGLGFFIVFSALLICCFVKWILSYWLAGYYRLDCISGSYRLDWLDWIGWIRLDNNGWMRTHSFCKDGNDGLDGALVGLGWDGRLLAPAGTGVTEQEHHHWLARYCKQGKIGIDGLDGALVGQGWDRRTLAGAVTEAPPLALEGQNAMQSGSWNQFRQCGVFVSDK